MTDHISPCPFCHERPGTRVGPPAVARCVTERCEGSKLAAVTIDRWNAAASRSSSGTATALSDANWKDAEEFCKGAFGPFVMDVSQYTKIVAELMQHATDRALSSGVAQRPLDLEVLCHDYAQRWHGEDWPLMDDEAKAELRMEAHRWLKCCSAVSWPTEPAQQPTIPVAREAAEPTQYLIDQFREHGTKPAAQEVPEPVAFQYRFQDDAGEWNGWFICDKHQYDRVTSNGKIGYCKAETRPLYTCSVPSTQSNTDAEPSRCKNTAARGESMETDALTGDAPVASVSTLHAVAQGQSDGEDDPYITDLKFAIEQNIKAARKYKARLDFMEVKYGAIDWDGTASPPAALPAGQVVVTPEMVSAGMAEIPEDGAEYEHVEAAYRKMAALAIPSTDQAPPVACPGGIDPGFDECPKCGATITEACAFSSTTGGSAAK